MAGLIFIDSIVFFVFLSIAIFILFRFKRINSISKSFFFLLLFYVVCSYSSYNMMVKPIHDYNMAIARTFIFHFKVIGPLAPLDIVFLISLMFIGLRKVAQGNLLTFRLDIDTAFFIKFILIQGVVIVTISTLAFVLHTYGGGKGQLADQLLYFRGIIYFLVVVYLYQLAVDDFKRLGFYKVFSLFLLLDVINAISGFISTIIYKDYVWSRYGINVSIIDQDDVYNFLTVYALLAVTFLFTKPIKRIYIYTAILGIGFLIFANIYKYIFMLAALFFFYDTFVNAMKGKVAVFKIMIAALSIVLLTSTIVMLSTSKSMNTRSGQITDYWEYTGSKFPASIIGIGHGGQFYSPTETDDDGEVKAILKESSMANYKRNIQTPVVSFIKTIGPLGTVIAIAFLIYGLMKITFINVRLPFNPLYNAIFFNLIWMMTVSVGFFQSGPFVILTIAKLLIFVTAIRQEEKVGEPKKSISS
ncbi:hypothetical protein JEM67_08630 [Serratia sp. PAMC26656]|uniref:hypothetical protein n=1 Tax=Serratia sp. PAMC26656 TaxID=2775909 RepID=UPI0018F3E36D|nr:hypothetical protein [Serratia sp. PAMC26656]MBJ7889794.1 hypothetical protein [Serratia sp. PAMC26656]